MSQENIDLVRVLYDVALARRTVEGFEDQFADDFAWHQRPEWPGRSVYKRDEMSQLWAELDDTYSDFTLVAVEFEEASDYVIVTVHTSARLRASDAHIEGTVWQVWRVCDGRAAEVRVYSSRDEALAGSPGISDA